MADSGCLARAGGAAGEQGRRHTGFRWPSRAVVTTLCRPVGYDIIRRSACQTVQVTIPQAGTLFRAQCPVGILVAACVMAMQCSLGAGMKGRSGSVRSNTKHYFVELIGDCQEMFDGLFE